MQPLALGQHEQAPTPQHFIVRVRRQTQHAIARQQLNAVEMVVGRVVEFVNHGQIVEVGSMANVRQTGAGNAKMRLVCCQRRASRWRLCFANQN